MEKIKDKLKKLLVAYLDEWVWEGEYDRASTEDIVDDILNPKVFPNIAVVDRHSVLPNSPYNLRGRNPNWGSDIAYQEAQQEMIKEGWVKEVK